MQKINSYPDGASMSRKFAPDLVTSDAHAAKQMSASGAGGGNKTPASKVHGGMDDYEPSNKGKSDYYATHKDQAKTWDDKKKK